MEAADLDTSEEKLFEMVEGSLNIKSFLGKPKDDGIQWGKSWAWFETLSDYQKANVLYLPHSPWTRILIKMMQKEKEAKRSGVFIFNMLRGRPSRNTGEPEKINDYPYISNNTRFHFVPWEVVVQNKMKDSSTEVLSHKDEFNGKQSGHILTKSLQFVLPKISSMKQSSKSNTEKELQWGVAVDFSVSSEKGWVQQNVESVLGECCTREFYLEVEKVQRAEDKQGSRSSSLMNTNDAKILHSSKEVIPLKNAAKLASKQGTVACLQKGRLSAFSLGAFVAKKLRQVVRDAFGRWRSKSMMKMEDKEESNRIASSYFKSLSKADKKELIAKIKGECAEDLTDIVASDFRFDIRFTRRKDILPSVINLRKHILEHRARAAFLSLEADEKEVESVKKKKKKRRKRSKQRIKVEEKDVKTKLVVQKEKKKVKTASPQLSRKKVKQMCKQVVSNCIIKKTLEIITKIERKRLRNIKKQRYKQHSRRRFVGGLLLRCIDNAVAIAEKRRERELKANLRGSKECQAIRKKIIEQRKRKRLRFQSPAESLNYNSFVLTPLCRNGREGMAKLASKQAYDGFWWWGGHISVERNVSLNKASSSKQVETVTMHCRFGRDCQRSDCPHPHRRKMSTPSTPVRSLVSKEANIHSSPIPSEKYSAVRKHVHESSKLLKVAKKELNSKELMHSSLSKIFQHKSIVENVLSFVKSEEKEDKKDSNGKISKATFIEAKGTSMMRAVENVENMSSNTASSEVKNTKLDDREKGEKIEKEAKESKDNWKRQQRNRVRKEISMKKCMEYYLSLFKNCGGEVSLLTNLSRDVKEFSDQIKTIVKFKKAAELTTVNALRRAIKQIWPGARAEIYGSFSTGLAIPSSDVDIVISNTEPVPKDLHNKQMTRVQRLAQHLSAQKWVEKVTMIAHATMPLVKVKALAGNVSVDLDLSFNSSFHRGLPTCGFIRSLCIEYPNLEALTLVMKQFLKTKRINNPYTGGLSSYGLVLMIASLLRRDAMFKEHLLLSYTNGEAQSQVSDVFSPSAKGLDTKTLSPSSEAKGETYEELIPFVQRGFLSAEAQLGRLLITFLDTFGRRFDPQLHAVSVSNFEDTPDYVFSGATQRHRFPGHTLVIIDPFNISNNIGRTCFNIWQIQQVFSAALNQITTSFADEQNADQYQPPDAIQPPVPPKRTLLGAFFSTPHHMNVLSRYFRTWVGSLSFPKKEDGKKVEKTESKWDAKRLVACSRAMQRKRALAVARIEDLQKQIDKRRELNDKMIQKAERRSLAFGKLAQEGNDTKRRGVDTIMSHVEDLTSYLAWINDQKRANIGEIEHLQTKIKAIKTEFYADMKALALRMGRAPFTIEQLQEAIQGPSSKNQKMKKLMDRKTIVARWRIAQLEEDIEEMEQMKVALEACAEYQVAKLAMQRLKDSTNTSPNKSRKSSSEIDVKDITRLEFDVKKYSKASMHTHALDWCPGVTPEVAEDDEREQTGNFLAWINQQNRANHMLITQLKAKVDKEKQKYIYDIARLTIESLHDLPSSPATPLPEIMFKKSKKK